MRNEKKCYIATMLIWSVLFSVTLADTLSKTATREPNMVADDKARDEAKGIIADTGIEGGLIVHLGCGDGKLTAALAYNDRYLVHGLDRDPQKVAVARRNIQSLGLYGPVSVETWEGSSLPYADNLVNLVVAEKLDRCSMEEVLRVLAPLGVALRQDGRWLA